jgi:dehydrogenase/reductase SDR family member 12
MSSASAAAAAWLGRALSRVVDPLIVPSFDRTGFRIHSLAFDPADLRVDLSGRRCLVTGGNSGIGFESARVLAERGADVVLLCRDAQRGQSAAEWLRKETGNPRVSVEIADMADLGSVRDAAARLGAGPVDVLVHNAGVLPSARVETRDGLELCFATHVAGPFLLTRALRTRLERSADARVVWVSSGGMYTRRLNLADPQWKRRDYDGVTAYAETKRAQVVLAELWARELEGSAVRVNAMHPGWADTPSVRSSLPAFHRITRAILRTPAEGADTVAWLAASERAAQWSGRFFFDREPRRTHFLSWTLEPERDRGRLWSLCERLTADPGSRATR